MGTHCSVWVSLQPGELWSEPGDPCVTHKCEKFQDALIVVTMKTECPKINCPQVSSGFPAPAKGAAPPEMKGGQCCMPSRPVLSSGRAFSSCLPLASRLIPPHLNASLPLTFTMAHCWHRARLS